MKRIFAPYQWPEGLYPLREWLRRKGVDVEHLKSERQAFWMARALARQRGRLPKDRSAPLLPAMLRLQRSLCPGGNLGRRAPSKRERHEPGTFGPASPVRRIDVAEYLAAKQRGEAA